MSYWNLCGGYSKNVERDKNVVKDICNDIG